MFHGTARRVKEKTFWENFRMKLIIFGGIFAIVFIIIMIILWQAGVFKQPWKNPSRLPNIPLRTPYWWSDIPHIHWLWLSNRYHHIIASQISHLLYCFILIYCFLISFFVEYSGLQSLFLIYKYVDW